MRFAYIDSQGNEVPIPCGSSSTGITGALDVLGTLDKVTTERLASVLLEKIEGAGFR
jgi:hypothetical protein